MKREAHAGDLVGRRFVVGGGLCLLAAASALRPLLGQAQSPSRSITFYNTHTREELSAVYFAAGEYDQAVLAQLNQILRDHRSGEVHAMDPPLFDYLFDVAAKAGVPPHFDVISGFRSPASNEYLQRTGGGGVSSKSLHMKGQAIDVRLRSVSTAKLRDIALGLERGGVGYYPQSDFVHLDTGRVRTWTGK